MMLYMENSKHSNPEVSELVIQISRLTACKDKYVEKKPKFLYNSNDPAKREMNSDIFTIAIKTTY